MTTLPDTEAQILRDLRAGGPDRLPALRARVAALREAGWTLVTVGTPLGANRSTTRMWQLTANPDDVEKLKNEVPQAPVKMAPARTVRMYTDVPPAELPELKRLAESARTVRGSTPADSQARKDALEFERLLRHYVEDRCVPKKRIAERLGVTHRAIAARLERSRSRDFQAAS